MSFLYKIAKFHIQPGDILISGPKTRDALRILFTDLPQGGERLSHAAIYVGGNQIVESWFGRGTYAMDFDRWRKNRIYHVYRVRGVSGDRAAKITKDLVGKDYDAIMAVRARLLPEEYAKVPSKERQSLNGLFCSTVITLAYPKIAKSLNKHPYSVLPVDIPKSPDVTLVHKEGKF